MAEFFPVKRKWLVNKTESMLLRFSRMSFDFDDVYYIFFFFSHYALSCFFFLSFFVCDLINYWLEIKNDEFCRLKFVPLPTTSYNATCT